MDPANNPKAAKYLLCSKNVAQRTLEKGFDTIDNLSLAVLTDTVYNYIEDVALTIKSDTEHSGRTDANLVDALHGLLQYGITSDDIVAYLAEKKDSAPSFHEPMEHQIANTLQGEGAAGPQKFLKSTTTSKRNRKSPFAMNIDHIPEFLRQFPLDITFSGEKMQDKQPTEKERAVTKFREKSSIEVNMERIADESQIKTESGEKPEAKTNPFLSGVQVVKPSQ